jgi:hypothetical protein
MVRGQDAGASMGPRSDERGNACSADRGGGWQESWIARIPEPSSVGLLCVAAALLGSRARRCRPPQLAAAGPSSPLQQRWNTPNSSKSLASPT